MHTQRSKPRYLACWQLVLPAVIALLWSCIPNKLVAQDDLVNCTDSFCVPSVANLPRSKAIVFRRENVFDYGIRSIAKSEDLTNGNGEVRNNRRYDFRFRLPVVMNPGLTVIFGANYFVEEYRFEDANQLDYPLYQRLEDKALKRLAGNVYVMKPFRGNKYLLARGSASLNGDYTVENMSKTEFMRGSLTVLGGIKKNPNTSYAIGFAAGYNFGRRSIIPVFAYTQSFNQYWGLDLVLPAKAQVRYMPNEKNVFYLGAIAQGANYSIQLQDLGSDQTSTYHLEKSELRYLLTYEREIHDWLWLGVEGGFRSNFQLDLTQVQGLQRDLVVQNRLNEAMVFGISLFVVPPRSFMNRGAAGT